MSWGQEVNAIFPFISFSLKIEPAKIENPLLEDSLKFLV